MRREERCHCHRLLCVLQDGKVVIRCARCKNDHGMTLTSTMLSTGAVDVLLGR